MFKMKQIFKIANITRVIIPCFRTVNWTRPVRKAFALVEWHNGTLSLVSSTLIIYYLQISNYYDGYVAQVPVDLEYIVGPCPRMALGLRHATVNLQRKTTDMEPMKSISGFRWTVKFLESQHQHILSVVYVMGVCNELIGRLTNREFS